ncbi:MAG: hypothetical protein ABEJ56_00215 [Candidatus Nanohaloarchaea archaeon]
MKGISQIITATLILLVGMSMASVYASWAPEFSRNVTSSVAEQENRKIECRNAGFSIKRAKYDFSANFTRVTVLNTGTINFEEDLTVASINNSRILNTKEVELLEVDEERNVTLDSNKTPGKVVIASSNCPEMERDRSVETKQ